MNWLKAHIEIAKLRNEIESLPDIRSSIARGAQNLTCQKIYSSIKHYNQCQIALMRN